MKQLFLGLLLSVTTAVHAKQCLHGDEVSEVCLSKAPIAKSLQNFLDLEKEIGLDSGTINYLDEFKVYTGEGIYGEFTYQNSSSASLTALGKWATKELGVYKTAEYDAFNMIKYAEKMDKKKFEQFINNALMDMKSHMADIASGDTDDFKPAMKKKVEKYLATKAAAKKALVDLVFVKKPEVVKEIVIYSLLDNNDSNVADAQFVIVSDDKVILVNRYWWL